MPNLGSKNIVLLKNLMENASHLDFGDEEHLKIFQKKADQFLKNTFGAKSEYRRNFHDIHFAEKSAKLNSQSPHAKEVWAQAVQSAIDLFQNIKEQEFHDRDESVISEAKRKKDVSSYILELDYTPESQALPADQEKSDSPLKEFESQFDDHSDAKLKYDQTPSWESIPHPEWAKAGQEVRTPILVIGSSNEALEARIGSVLSTLGFEAVLTKHLDEEGLTIVQRIKDDGDIHFAIIILNADDLGYSKDQGGNQARLRSRQSVIFDLGFLVGRLGRERVLALYENVKDFELPKSFFEVIYTPLGEDEGWVLSLVRQLQKAGFKIDANQIIP